MRKYCLQILKAAPRGDIVPHVINGSPLIVQHAAAVFATIDANNNGYFGGGSIISDRHILTGANLILGLVLVIDFIISFIYYFVYLELSIAKLATVQQQFQRLHG